MDTLRYLEIQLRLADALLQSYRCCGGIQTPDKPLTEKDKMMLREQRGWEDAGRPWIGGGLGK